MVQTFTPSFKVVDHIEALPLGSTLKPEKMFYQSTPDFVHSQGGPIVREFVERLPDSLKTGNVIVDVRIHHLQKGYYPAIPGYHLDWIPRKNKGQDVDLSVIPDYEHVVMILAETSLTEFVAEEFDPCICYHLYDEHATGGCGRPSGNYIYDSFCTCREFKSLYDYKGVSFKHYNDAIKESGIKTQHVANGQMIQFTSRDWHRPSPAEKTEWRMLIRASRVDHAKPVNEIRTQAQVYIPIEEANW